MKQKVGFGETIGFLHRICSAMGKKQKVYWLGSFLGAMEILNTILIPFVFQKMIQMVSDPGSSSFKDIMMVILLLGAVLFVTPVISLGSYLQHESVIVGKNIIRKRLFAHVQRLPVTDIQKRDTGEYMVLLSSDVDRAYGLLQGHGMRSCYQFLVVLPVTAGILLYYSPYVAAAAIPVSLAAIWFSAIFNPRVSRLGKEALKEMGASAGPLTELVCGSSMVRIFSGYPWILQKFSQICRSVFEFLPGRRPAFYIYHRTYADNIRKMRSCHCSLSFRHSQCIGGFIPGSRYVYCKYSAALRICQTDI